MKGKLVLHYFVTFIAACSLIFIINILFMWRNIYKQGKPYNFEPKKYIKQVEDTIQLMRSNQIGMNEEGLKLLENYNSGIQLLDEDNREVFSYNTPKDALKYYSNIDLLDMFTNNDTTMFYDEKILGDKTYTYLLFLDRTKVNRLIYTYDVSSLREAHHFPLLIIINSIMILILSFLYTIRIARPMGRIIDRIGSLSEGDYSKTVINTRGIYVKVDEKLNQLAERLTENEQERVKIEKMREEWISNITHDIKTPLTSIIGNTEILGDTEYELSDTMRHRYCSIILNKSQYIKTLVEDLNLSTRLKTNTLVLHKAKVNIVSLVRHVLIDVINDEKYNDRNITFQYEEEVIYLEMDEQLMKRVFVNLIINAFIHNDEDVKVKLDIKKDETYVIVSIEDNGKGVIEAEQKDIFKRYYRGTHTRNKTEGSGLGLAIAHDIVKAHEGKIEIVSEQGEGLKISMLFQYKNT